MKNWLGVVSATHVQRGVTLGIAQVSHGKRGPLARMKAGDALIYYSPVEHLGDTTPLRRFTALATLPDDEIFEADEGGFTPFRRRADYHPVHPVALDDVRQRLHLTASPSWGRQLRLGLLPLDDHDAAVLRDALLSGTGG
ncbi:EVE domain-containing protein [Subtercola sp. YIM 133946]|uniref:EVE domain-containing protein n=1 Tax=Subtercola sp. YIM 133946 TaxID=3118909 RepID=UPI002F93BEAE